MSTETTEQPAAPATPEPAPPEPPPWPEPEVSELPLCFKVPHIFVSAPDGHTTLREGGVRDVITRTEIWYTDKKQPDEEVFKVKAETSVLFGGHTIFALTDAGMHGKRNLMDSTPPAREWMKRVGQRVNTFWESKQVNAKSPFYIHMKRPVIFCNKRVSIDKLP